MKILYVIGLILTWSTYASTKDLKPSLEIEYEGYEYGQLLKIGVFTPAFKIESLRKEHRQDIHSLLKDVDIDTVAPHWVGHKTDKVKFINDVFNRMLHRFEEENNPYSWYAVASNKDLEFPDHSLIPAKTFLGLIELSPSGIPGCAILGGLSHSTGRGTLLQSQVAKIMLETFVPALIRFDFKVPTLNPRTKEIHHDNLEQIIVAATALDHPLNEILRKYATYIITGGKIPSVNRYLIDVSTLPAVFRAKL